MPVWAKVVRRIACLLQMNNFVSPNTVVLLGRSHYGKLQNHPEKQKRSHYHFARSNIQAPGMDICIALRVCNSAKFVFRKTEQAFHCNEISGFRKLCRNCGIIDLTIENALSLRSIKQNLPIVQRSEIFLQHIFFEKDLLSCSFGTLRRNRVQQCITSNHYQR